MKVLGISGTLVGSKTKLIVEEGLKILKDRNVDVTLVDFKGLQLDFCDGRPSEAYSTDVQALMKQVAEADAFIIGTTILHGSMPGVLKNFFELMPVDAFHNKSVLFVGNGGNHLHYLAIENYVKPVANYLNMYVYPQYAFILSSEFDGQNQLIGPKSEELEQLVLGFEKFAQSLAKAKEEIV